MQETSPVGDPLIATYTPICKPGSLVPIFGDLNGDGALDCVIRMDNGNREMSQDSGVPVQMETFTSYGRSLWRKDICFHDHCYGSANNVPFNVWDMDGDGRAEVITRLQIGDTVYAAILDGMSGHVKHKTPWVPIATDHQGSSTRIHLSIAYLDGNHPAVVTQSGLYENEIFTAYDAKLNPMWQFKSFGETSGSGGHKIEVADVDGDGKQEVFNGTTCINHDGSLRWSLYRQHPDIVSNSHILMVADLCGDFRDELVLGFRTQEGKDAVGIITASKPVGKRYLAAWEDLDYRLWVTRNRGGGYASIYDRQLQSVD